MKRTIIASILGVAACAAVNETYGQGSFIFSNYSYGSVNYSAPVTYGAGSGGLTGQLVDSSFTAALLYSTTGQAGSFNLVAGTQTPFYSNAEVSGFQGLFAQSGVTLSSYVSGPAYFEVEAYNGTAYGSGTTTYEGISGVVVFTRLATAADLDTAGSMFQDNAEVTTPLTAWTVTSVVPEPTTLAMLGLGGLASLVAFRRKKA